MKQLFLKNLKIPIYFLNQEALALKYPTTYDTLNKHQKTLRHLFSCHHQKIILSYALRDLNGGDLVVSSINSK